MASPYDAAALQARIHADIPLTRAMGIAVSHLEAGRIRLEAPPEPNVNHQGTAFGGSLAALAMTAGWGLLVARGDAEGLSVDWVIRHGEARFLRPAEGRLAAECEPPGDDAWAAFRERLARACRARAIVEPRVLDARGALAVRFRCEYVALTRSGP